MSTQEKPMSASLQGESCTDGQLRNNKLFLSLVIIGFIAGMIGTIIIYASV